MIIKKIILDNIRSFEHEEIEFNEGSTLLAGDIGSGKTSVLMAIEFGLFGLQPGQRGSMLLRNDASWASVKLTFEVQGKDYFVERTLKRTKTVSQDYAAITIDNEKLEMSVTELKSKVLAILNYPQEFSKKQNLLYKFTVYTPQEEMKQIILEDKENRLNTLRHVFGVDKYKKIIENAGTVRLKIREERRLYQGITLSLDEEIEKKEKKELFIREKEKVIPKLKDDLSEKIKLREKKESEKEDVSKHLEGRSELRAKLGKTQGLLHSKREILENNKKIMDSIKKEIQEVKILNYEEEQIQNLEEEALQKKKQKEKLNEFNLSINSELRMFESKIIEGEKLQKKMQDLDVCPTCYQKVDAIYRANVLNKNYNDVSQAKKRIEELEIEKKTTKQKISELEISLDLISKKLTDLKILRMKFDTLKDKEIKQGEMKKQNTFLESDIKLLEKQIESIKSDILILSKYDNLFEEKSKELALAQREENRAEITLAEHKKEIDLEKKALEDLEERIKKVEKAKIQLDYLSDLETWLNTKFIPLINFLEKNVMANLKHEFSKLFSEWFTILVPEGLNARLSDDFTPIIEQKDYEIDYSYLSGGERTAIALAYRLSLNQVINSLMSEIKTKEIVILDEPTDGFSSEQLDKMREVLDQLNVKQMIIVSHEQKMEGFVENVIKFKKEYGISRKI